MHGTRLWPHGDAGHSGLTVNQKSKATGLLSQFPQQTQVIGFCSQSSRVSSKGEWSFTGAQCIHVVRWAGPAPEDTKEIYVGIFISISHSLIQQIHPMQMPPPGCVLGQMREESNLILPLRTLQFSLIISHRIQLKYKEYSE